MSFPEIIIIDGTDYSRSVDACPVCISAGFEAKAVVEYRDGYQASIDVIKYVCGRVLDTEGDIVIRQCSHQAGASIDSILAEREATHGKFSEVAELHEAILRLLIDKLPLERPIALSLALDMIVLKLARMACGDHLEEDHYRDIAGYAQLAVREIKTLKSAKKI